MTLLFFLFSSRLGAHASEPLTFEFLQNQIVQHHVQTVEQLLPLLPKSYLQNYTLLKKSSALQTASPDLPRVVVYGEDGRFVITFNSDNLQAGGNVVETMEFKENSFEFRTITFNERPEYSEANPITCTGCHGINHPSPLWDNAHDWKHSFAHLDDYISDDEKAVIAKFIENPRYATLGKDAANPNYPFRKDDSRDYSQRGNARWSNLMIGLQAKQLANTIRESDFFKNHPDFIMMALLQTDCGLTDTHLDSIWQILKIQFESLYGSYYLKKYKDKSLTFFIQKMIFDLAFDPFQLEFGSRIPVSDYHSDIATIDQLVLGELQNDFNMSYQAILQSSREPSGFNSLGQIVNPQKATNLICNQIASSRYNRLF